MNTSPTRKVIDMSVRLEDLFSEKHKETIVKALGEIGQVDMLRTMVTTPAYMLDDKQLKGKACSHFEAYEVTIISDYRLISSLIKKTLPLNIEATKLERDTMIAETLIENICEQYSEIITYH